MIQSTRRGFIAGLGALFAAPAIVRIESLMPVRMCRPEIAGANGLLTMREMTREAIRLWHSSSSFLTELDRQYDEQFAREGALIGTSFKIRLPGDRVLA